MEVKKTLKKISHLGNLDLLFILHFKQAAITSNTVRGEIPNSGDTLSFRNLIQTEVQYILPYNIP